MKTTTTTTITMLTIHRKRIATTPATLLGTLLLMFILSASVQTQAQMSADTCYTVGLYGGMQFNTFTGSYTSLPGAQNCCPVFDKGSASKPYIGVLFGVPLHKQLSAQLRAGLANFGTTQTRQEFIGNALQPDGNDFRVVDALSEHKNAVSASTIEITPRVQWYPVTSLPLYLHAGASILLQTGMSVEQSESLVSPSGRVVYSDTRTTSRNTVTADVSQKTSLLFAPVAGIGYDIRFGDSQQFTLSPELQYIMPLGGLVEFQSTAEKYTVSALRAGVAFMYSLPRSTTETNETRTETPPPSQPLIAGVVAKEVLEIGERNIARVIINETISSQLYPLIPYVFFDENSAELPSRYIRYTPAVVNTFDTTKLYTFDNSDKRSDIVLKVYHDILNIIGSRMKRYPDAVLTVAGFNNDRNDEKGNTSLSRRRAENVKAYLRTVWGIPESNIVITESNLSPKAAKTTMADARDKEDGFEENRRVELSSTVPAVLQPLQVFDTLRAVQNPLIRFYMNARSSAGVRDWKLTATHPDLVQNSPYLMRKEQEGTPPQYLEWTTENNQRNVPRSEKPIAVQFDVSDRAGNKANVPSELPVQINTVAERRKNLEGNIEVNTYRVVGFEYESSDKSATVERIMQEFVNPDASNADTISVRGYTDRKGDAARNQQLAQQRAESIRNQLRAPQAYIIQPLGMKEDQAQFLNDLPEERMYNRMVEVVVRKNSK
ncbi:MAG: OmpA family protein [Candidatus Kapabacteria bacterium]|nr:OmpA family protein [Candidatus Kapabacteria bacterium]